MRKRTQPLAVAVLACLLAACNRQPSGEDGATADTAASHDAAPVGAQHDPTGQEDPEAIAKAYYAALVKQYGQDYEACGPSERTLPKDCDAARDVPGARPGARSNVLLMLDASGSMAARIGRETKMAVAQDALVGFTRKLSESADVALRVYGHTGNNKESGKAESCAGTELLYPFQKLDAGKFETAIRSFQPTGWTPIAASLDAAAADFAKASSKEGANVVYVVSDGIETCDADPVSAARKLHESDIDVVVNVIGFDVDAEAARQLEAVAKAGGGEYLTANTRADLDRVFNERWTEAQKRYLCVFDEEQRAYLRTWDAQQKRHLCLWDKAQKEFLSIWDHAQHEYTSTWDQSEKEYKALRDKLEKDDSIDPERRAALLEEAESRRDRIQTLTRAKTDYAQAQAKIKAESIQKPAGEEADRVQNAAKLDYEKSQQAAKEEYEQAQDRAAEERDAGQ